MAEHPKTAGTTNGVTGTMTLGRRQRLTWVTAIAAAFGIAAWIILGIGQFTILPGQGSELAQQFTAYGDEEAGDSGPTTLEGRTQWGALGGTSTLVLYDTAGSEAAAEAAEVEAIATGNLATHFGGVTAMPVQDYSAGLIDDFDGVVYLGSVPEQDVPMSLPIDVLDSEVPVMWAGANIDDLQAGGRVLPERFEKTYGWDPLSYEDSGSAPITEVLYHQQTLTRDKRSGPIRVPQITAPGTVQVLASAAGPDTADEPTPWALRSGNLTYLAEVPFDYVDESDRYLVFADLFYDLLAPDTGPLQQAAVRLEDVDAAADPQQLRDIADYLYEQEIPFQVAVVPIRISKAPDADSDERIGLSLADRPDVLDALRYMQDKGGTLIQHGTTHQYGSLDNPYNNSSGADFEFYRAQCSATQDKPYQFEPCETDSYVINTGPVERDAQGEWMPRLIEGRDVFVDAGLGAPTIFETPHYAASTNAYQAMNSVFDTRYERSQYFPGQLSGGPAKTDGVMDQFFPYKVNDIYGSTVLPENLGNVTEAEQNNHEIRDPQFIVDGAQANLVVRESTASFFYHPFLGVDPLREVIEGIQNLGYTFVPAADLA